MSARGIVLTIVLAGGIGLAAGYAIVQHSLARERAAWQAEKVRLENELAQAQGRPAAVRTIIAPGSMVEVTNTISPEEILEQLVAMKASANDPRSTRRLVHAFESLIDAGPAALPAIRAFLARNQDVE